VCLKQTEILWLNGIFMVSKKIISEAHEKSK
jgi:hypothetical protein